MSVIFQVALALLKVYWIYLFVHHSKTIVWWFSFYCVWYCLLNSFIIHHYLILQASRRELIQMDFEAILKYFRISMPKKYLDEEEYKKLVNSALGFRVCADDVIFIK